MDSVNNNYVFPKLYKMNLNGKIQQWEIEVDENKYRTIHGQVEGKLVISEWTECWGKNIGRANETTANQQAMLEAEAKWKKQRDTNDYTLEIPKSRVIASGRTKPMLAHKYTDKKASMDLSDAYSQPKLDGIRCLVSKKHGMYSRQGKDIVSCPHILEVAKQIVFDWDLYPSDLCPDDIENMILDGELYNHTLRNEFEKIVSLARKTKPKEYDIAEAAAKIQYWVYDVIIPGKELTFEQRYNILKHIPENLYIMVVPTNKVENQEDLDELYSQYLEAGYEGQMVRSGKGNYEENKRSKYILKRKEFIDDEFVITGTNYGKGNWGDVIKTLTVKDKNNKEFAATIKGDYNYLMQLTKIKDNLIGKEVTVRYQNLTADGIPRFPIAFHIWIDGKRDI